MIPQGYPSYPSSHSFEYLFQIIITFLRRDKIKRWKTNKDLPRPVSVKSVHALSSFLHCSTPHEGQTGRPDPKGSPTAEPDWNNLTKRLGKVTFYKGTNPLRNASAHHSQSATLEWSELNTISTAAAFHGPNTHTQTSQSDHTFYKYMC